MKTFLIFGHRPKVLSTEPQTPVFWHVDGDFYYFTNLLFFPSRLVFGIAGRHFGMSTRHFGMSTGTTLLACRRYFWHVDASYPTLTAHLVSILHEVLDDLVDVGPGNNRTR